MKKSDMNNVDNVSNVAEVLTQLIEGTDDRSMAKGLAYALLETLTSAAHEVADCLFRGEADTNGILTVINDNIAFVRHNTAKLREMTSDFEGLCSSIRKGDNS